MTTTYAYAASDAQSKLAPFEFQRRELRANDVQMEVLFCGVCHSDLHQARNEWKNSVYPVVPGARNRRPRHGGRLGRRALQGRRSGRRGLPRRLVPHLPRVAPKVSNSIARTALSPPITAWTA